MNKLQIVSLFSFLQAITFYVFWQVASGLGVFILWIPATLRNPLNVDGEVFTKLLSDQMHLPANEFLWQMSIGNGRFILAGLFVLFTIIAIITLVLSFRKKKTVISAS